MENRAEARARPRPGDAVGLRCLCGVSISESAARDFDSITASLLNRDSAKPDQVLACRVKVAPDSIDLSPRIRRAQTAAGIDRIDNFTRAAHERMRGLAEAMLTVCAKLLPLRHAIPRTVQLGVEASP